MVSIMRPRRSSTFQKENYRRLTAQGIGAQYHSPVIALAGHMVKRSGQFHSRLSRHRSDKTTPIKQNESLTPPPPLARALPRTAARRLLSRAVLRPQQSMRDRSRALGVLQRAILRRA